jgi:hypothetical protein
MIRQTVAFASFVVFAAGSALGRPEYRSYDGSGNNLGNPTMGAAGTNLLRLSTPAYADGLASMAGPTRPNPRDISNAVAAQAGSLLNSRNLSDMIWQWGQFIDHDLDLTSAGTTEAAPVPTSVADPFFVGTPIGFSRSIFDAGTGTVTPRQQPNELTSFIDGSMVYGSDAGRAGALRTLSGGRLLTSFHPTGDMMPFNTLGLPNGSPGGSNPADFFVAGDVRSNEQAGLTAMHTLWVREHNRRADQVASANPGMSDEDIYQTARKIVGAEIQKITYSDWLPALLGPGRVSAYAGYDASEDGSVASEFSTAAFRIGHTLLSPTLARLNNDGSVIAQGNLDLRDAFFNPLNVTTGGGIDPLLKGLASQAAQEIDNKIVDDVRNFLFGPPGSGGFDLATLNVQRGRDHGLCDYNTMRVELGLTAKASFAEISSDPAVQAALASVYPDVNSIDPWVGMLAEDHLPGGSVGELMALVIVDQFERTRDGDRFFFLNDPDLAPYLSEIQALGLGDIIEFNTGITTLQADVFFVPSPAAIAMAGLGAAVAGFRRRRGAEVGIG